MKRTNLDKNYVLLKSWWDNVDLTNYEKNILNESIRTFNEETQLSEHKVNKYECKASRGFVLDEKSISIFKSRIGTNAGLKVTLRNDRMYEFIDRLVNIALPRVRDFRGISNKSFDGKGNYTLGLKEQFIFPEIEFDTVDTPRVMDITIVTTAKTDEEAKELLKNFNFPFVK